MLHDNSNKVKFKFRKYFKLLLFLLLRFYNNDKIVHVLLQKDMFIEEKISTNLNKYLGIIKKKKEKRHISLTPVFLLTNEKVDSQEKGALN